MGESGLILMDGAMSPPTPMFDLRPNYGRGNEDNGNFLQKSFKRTCAHTVVFSAPDPAAGHC